MAEIIMQWGSIATALIALITLISLIFAKLSKITKTFCEIKEHTEENYLNNLRLVIMSHEMPIEERLNAGEKYVKSGGNGQIKAFYKKLEKEYLESEEK